MSQESNNTIQSALQAIRERMSVAEASREFEIPRSSLRDKIEGRNSRREAHVHRQRLSPVQEKELVTRILTRAELGLAPTHVQVRGVAQRIAAGNEDNNPLGAMWLHRFFQRTPKVKTLRAHRIEYQRVIGCSEGSIRQFFEVLAKPVVEAIKPENRWNMDETGVQEGVRIKGLVVGHAERASLYVKSPQPRTWTTIIEAISVEGECTDPLVIGVFLSLKSGHRKALHARVTTSAGSSSGGNKDFLRCYLRARKQGLSSQNIKSGWKATGRWPVSIRKPLSSSQILPSQQQAEPAIPSCQQIQREAPDILRTPKKGGDLLVMGCKRGVGDTHDGRAVLRAGAKALDAKIAENEMLKQKIATLEHKLELL